MGQGDRVGYGDRVRNKERRSELTMKEKLDWDKQLEFVVGKGELRVGIDLGHQVLRETLGVDGQEERGPRRETGTVIHQQSTVCLTEDLFLSHFTDEKTRSQGH